MLRRRIVLILLLTFLISILIILQKKPREITFKGVGWYGYLADDKINKGVLEKIKALGGDSININVYYEYDIENESFILLSNLTKVEEKIKLAHEKGMNVFLSPFANLVGGHYLANQIKTPEKFLKGAKNISLSLAIFGEKNDVEIYGVWNELGLAILKAPNSTELTNKWLQETREEVKKVYDNKITTKEGIQLGIYEDYNFSGFDYIGVTFYPFTSSCHIDEYSNMTFCGVENLEDYEKVVKKELEKLIELKEKFKSKGIILGEIGIDVVGEKIIRNDKESNRIRTEAYQIILKNGKGKIDGFFLSKFEYDDGGSQELDKILKYYFQ